MNKVDIEDIYRLSPLQEGMLFDSLSEENRGLYVYQLSYALRGQLDVDAFRQAWQQLVDRHQLLRASFHWQDIEHPVAVIHRRATLPFTLYDWCKIPAAEQQARLDTFIQEKQNTGLDLTRAPLMQIDLIHRADDRYHFIWSFHHLLLDAWSTALLLQEAFTRYHALREKRPYRPQPVRPYREYIEWIQQQDVSKVEAFWRQELQGLTSPTPLNVGRLSTDNLAPVTQYAEQHHVLSAEESIQFRDFARRHNLTLNTLFQGAWALLLSRYSGTDDVLFGSIVSGRSVPLPGIENMVGLFVNLLPARLRVDPDWSVHTYLHATQARQVAMRDFEFSSLVQIKRWSALPKTMRMFESILIFENWFGEFSPAAGGPELEISEMAGYQKGLGHPIAVAIEPQEQVTISINYDRQRFDSDTIRRMLGHYQTLLHEITAKPESRLGDLSLLTANEHAQLIDTWNQTAADYPREQCLHQLIESQVRRTPDAIALHFGDQQVSYRELDRRANQLAHFLREKGVETEDLVGIFIERGLEMFVALLGVLKAGAAYVPLDPAYPEDRIRYVLEDSGATLLLSNKRTLEHFEALRSSSDLGDSEHAERSKIEVVWLDRDWPAIARQPSATPQSRVQPENLAYVIYTSGSTGRPKGVAIQHCGLVNLMQAMREKPGLTAEDTLPCFTTISFDMAVPELYLPLAAGGRILLLPREAALDGHLLAQALEQEQVGVLQATPTTWRLLLEAGWQGHPAFKLVCGAEPMPSDLPEMLLQRGRELWNMYGPTETTVWSTAKRMTSAESPITVGRPLFNTQIYLCDQRLRPVPVAIPAEVFIAGDGLARGYFQRPELTAERFIPCPFARAERAGARMYATGDLARYLPDGEIEHLGRSDFQVKIRGYRIELGEIEAMCVQFPGVAQAVVVAHDRGADGQSATDRRLVAYIVPETDKNLDVQALRSFLQSTLPDYMVPSAYVKLEALPLNANGKIDRKALPALEQGEAALSNPYKAPKTETEKAIARVWQEILKVDRVGVEDNFFELGGHSLLAMQIMSRVRKALGAELSIDKFFAAPTVAALARAIESQRSASGPQADGRTGITRISRAKRRLKTQV